MNMALLIAVCGAVMFFRIAQYERMYPWAWGIASFGITLALSTRGASTLALIAAQIALFLGLWAYKAYRVGR
jgi:hypothetical protein